MGGAPSLPTPSTPGYTSFRGFTACVCLAKWLPVYERLLLAKGLVTSRIDIWQLTGSASASALTHTRGGAADLFQFNNSHVEVAREMGAPASWRRSVAQGFTRDHQHFVLTGCPHNAPAAYQITAQKRGYSGLGVGASGTPYAGMSGYGSRDYHTRPSVYRTWQQGIAWAETEIARIQEESMPTPADLWGAQFASPSDGKSYAASTWLVMANVKAGDAKALAGQANDKAAKAVAQTDTLEASVAALKAQNDGLASTLAAVAKALSDLSVKVDALPKG